LEKKPLAESSYLKNPEQNLNKGAKILIAEDDDASEILITKALGIISKEILIAKTGLEAVEICRNNPDIDLVFMDIKMPLMSGYEAAKKIRQFNNDVIIIAQTAFGLSDSRKKAIEAGCNDYISKPIIKSALIKLIKKHYNPNNNT
jgi:CheY-like chemotaxis protein